MGRKFLLPLFCAVAVLALGYSFRDFDWYRHESEHFIYLYHGEIADTVPLLEEIAEESYARLSEFYNREFSHKIVVQISGYEDVSNGIANPVLDTIHVVTLGLDYRYRKDSYWLRTVIAHELSHLFQLGATNGLGELVRKYLSRLYLPNALQPMWLSEGYAQLGSRLVRADEYSYRRLPFLLDQLALEEPFSEETIVAGFSDIGAEAYYNFGFAFVEYLLERYGEEKLAELVELKSGFLGFAGIEPAFSIVFGKTYAELKKDFIDHSASWTAGIEDPVIHKYSLEKGEGTRQYKSKTYAGKVYYVHYDRDKNGYALFRESTQLLSVTLEIIDYSVFESEIALLLLEKGDGDQTRLYFFRDGKLTRSDHSHILGLDYLGKDRLAVLKNEKGTPSVQTLSLRNGRVTEVYRAPDGRVQLDNLRTSNDGDLILFRANVEGLKHLALYSLRSEELKFFPLEGDFTIGSWSGDGFLISLESGLASEIYLFGEDGTLSGKASFPRYVKDPVETREGILASGQFNGFKLLVGEARSDDSPGPTLSQRLELESLAPVQGRRYDGFSSWRFVSLLPWEGLSALFCDLSFKNRLLVGGGYDFSKFEPVFHAELSSEDYLPVDFRANFRLAALDPEASVEIWRNYRLAPKFGLGWRSRVQYPFKVRACLSASLEDASILYGGRAVLKTVITLADTQTASTNLADLSINVYLDWELGGFEANSHIFSRVTFGEDPTVSPVELWNFSSDSNIVLGLSLDSNYTLSRRNLNLFNVLYFSKEGLGGRVDLLIGSDFFWRLTAYKSETVYLYGAYPVQLKAGLMLEGLKLLPYFDFQLSY